MKKLLIFCVLTSLLVGCNTIKYKKTVVRDGCGNSKTTLVIEDQAWSDIETQKILNNFIATVKKEKLYVNEIKFGFDRVVRVYASDVPTSLEDIREARRHKYHMIREEKCDCRLCK